MDKIEFKGQLRKLVASRNIVTSYSMKSPAKYLMVTLLNSIRDVITTLHSLQIPDELEPQREQAMLIIKDAKRQIDLEYEAAPDNLNMVERVSDETIHQVDRIRAAVKKFDAQGLDWLRRQ